MMMDSYCFEDLEEMFWSEPPLPVVIQSSFVPYTKPIGGNRPVNPIKGQNIHKRMIEFLKAIPNNSTSDEHQEIEKDRSYRHMINERSRRQKQKHTYTALHSLLPQGTKNDKNSILTMAALHLQELKGVKENLHKRNRELEKNVPGETTRINLKWQTPTSGIDSMIGALTCLKKMGLKARKIQSEFSVAEFVAVMEIEPKIEAVVAEKAVERALVEVHKKFVFDMPSTEYYW